MATMTDLIEYLLAYTLPGGGKLCRYGALLLTIPAIPPGWSGTWTVTPYFNSFMSIEYYYRFNPEIVPDTILWESQHVGVQVGAGLVSAIATSEGFSAWLEITQQTPIRTTLTNVSAVNQFFEVIDFFLIIDSEENYRTVKEIVAEWCPGKKIIDQLQETNRYLRALVEAMPGAEQVLKPQPPITGRS